MVLSKFHRNKIPLSPSINIKDIFSITFNFNALYSEATYKELLYKSEYCLNYSRSTYSLYKLYNFLNQSFKNKKTIFIPDYICNEALSLLRETGSKLVFYDHDLINKKELIKEMHIKNAEIFLYVNYFGQKIKLNNQFKDFIKERNIFTIEDNTHCICSLNNNFSDVEIYSPHKLFGIPNGGVIKFKDEITYKNFIEYDNPPKFNSIINFFDQVLSFYIYLIKKTLRYLSGYKYPELDFQNKIQSKKLIRKNINLFSLYLLNLYSIRLGDYKNKRLKNYYEWQKYLNLIIPFLSMDKLNNIPYLGVLRFKSSKERLSILKQYNNLGLPISNWPDLPPEVTSSKSNYKIAKLKFLNQLTIPLHQDINSQKIRACILKSFEKYINTFKVFYLSKKREVHIYRNKILVGKLFILFNSITNQNILRLKFNSKFYITYLGSRNFFYNFSIEIINKLNINTQIHLPEDLKHLSRYNNFKYEGIKENLIPLTCNIKRIKQFILSSQNLIYCKSENSLMKLENSDFDFVYYENKSKNIEKISIRKKRNEIVSLKVKNYTDHILLKDINIISDDINFLQSITLLCTNLKKQKYRYLEISRNLNYNNTNLSNY